MHGTDSESSSSARNDETLKLGPHEIASLDDVTDFRIGDFRIIRELGRGGMGVVYLAEDLQLRRKVALKILPGGFGTSRADHARFQREAEAASRLDHPNICGVLRVGQTDGMRWIAMRYVEGRDLRDLLKEPSESMSLGSRARREAWRRDVEVVQKLAVALQIAHDSGIVHRDLKPGNVRITPDGEPVVLDFGLAQDLDDEGPALTQSGDILGTPSYMAPEQIRGESHRADARTDVWALGVILYEVIARQHPFQAATREMIYRNILDSEPPPLRRHAPQAPRDLQTVVMTALEKDPRRRYESAKDLADDLRAVLDIRPIRARAAGPVARTLKLARRRPAAAALVVVVLLGAPVVTSLLVERHRRETALRENVEAQVSTIETALADGRAGDARRGLDALAEIDDDRGRIDELERACARLEAVERARILALDGDSDPTGTLARAAVDALGESSLETASLRALICLRTGDGDEARRILEEHETAHPGRGAADRLAMLDAPPDARTAPDVFAVMALSARGRVQEALSALETLAEARPRDHALAWLAAEEASRAQLYRAALAWAGRARALTGELTAARLGRYSVHLRRAGRADDAVNAAAEARRARPDDPVLAYHHAAALSDVGDLELSERIYDELLADHPRFARGWSGYSTLLLDLKRIDEAITAAARARDLHRTDADFWLNHGTLLLEAKRVDEAIVSIEESLRLRPDFPYALNSLGVAYKLVRRLDDAQRAFQKAVDLKPDYAGAIAGLASVAWLRDDFEAAAALYRRALEHQPDLTVAVVKLGTMYMRLGRLEDAEREYRRAIEMGEATPDTEALGNLSVILSNRGELDGALEHARRAAELYPSVVDNLRNAASVHMARQEFPEATAYLERARALAPGDEPVQLSLAVMLEATDPVRGYALVTTLTLSGAGERYVQLGQIIPALRAAVARVEPPHAMTFLAEARGLLRSAPDDAADELDDALDLIEGLPAGAPGSRAYDVRKAALLEAAALLRKLGRTGEAAPLENAARDLERPEEKR